MQKTPYDYEFTKPARLDDFSQSFLYVSPGQLPGNILRGMVWEYSPWNGLGILFVELLRKCTKKPGKKRSSTSLWKGSCLNLGNCNLQQYMQQQTLTQRLVQTEARVWKKNTSQRRRLPADIVYYFSFSLFLPLASFVFSFFSFYIFDRIRQ